MDSSHVASKHFIDANIINPFLNGTIAVFEQMLYMKPDYGKPFLVERGINHRWEITGIIGMVGDGEGIVALRLTNFLLEKLLDKTGLQIDSEEERPSIMNGLISELVNVISSKATAKLKDYEIRLTPPFTVQGKNHKISWPSQTPIIAVPFRTQYGPFEVELSITCKSGCKQ